MTPEQAEFSEDCFSIASSGSYSQSTSRCDTGTQTSCPASPSDCCPQHLDCVRLHKLSCSDTGNLPYQSPETEEGRGRGDREEGMSRGGRGEREEGRGEREEGRSRKKRERGSLSNFKQMRRGRKKSSAKRLFLGNRSLLAEGGGVTERAGRRSLLEAVDQEDEWDELPMRSSEDGGRSHMEDEPSVTPPQHLQEEESENSWTCPLTSDELSPSPIDTRASIPSRPKTSQSSSSGTRNNSGMILKLRRVLFPNARKGQEARYQTVSVSEHDLHRDRQTPLSGDQADRGREPPKAEARDRTTDRSLSQRLSSKRPPCGPRRRGFSSALCHLAPRTSSGRLPSSLRRSVLKIKYCPFLSACHSSAHRRRWVLRSAVQRARRAMTTYYPDLVGRRIQHLYEEGDGSEVWYRGLVVQVHEPHPNPLNTVFQVKYDSEPEWQYYLELLLDYQKGWLKIED